MPTTTKEQDQPTTAELAKAADADLDRRDRERLEVHDATDFSNLLDTARFEHLFRVANMFASSTLVPKHFQGQPANCMVACQMAIRLQLDPMMLMQNTYVVNGRPGMEAKLVIALVNSRGPFTGPIQFELSGQGETRQCRAYAQHKVTGQVCEQIVSMKIAHAEGWVKNNPKWTSMPDMMLCYRAASWLARLYAPECLMGMQTSDELLEVEATERSTFDASQANGAASRGVEAVMQRLEEKRTATAESSGVDDDDDDGDGDAEDEAEAAADDAFEDVDKGDTPTNKATTQKRFAELIAGCQKATKTDSDTAEEAVVAFLKDRKFNRSQLWSDTVWMLIQKKPVDWKKYMAQPA